jgi:hypothetical protein
MASCLAGTYTVLTGLPIREYAPWSNMPLVPAESCRHYYSPAFGARLLTHHLYIAPKKSLFTDEHTMLSANAIWIAAAADQSLREHVHPKGQTLQIPTLAVRGLRIPGSSVVSTQQHATIDKRHCRNSILCTSIVDTGNASWVRLITAIHWCDRHLGGCSSGKRGHA